jgi:DNA-binding protein HU-beta
MTKADLVAIMAKAAGGSKVSAERALDAFMDGVFAALRKGRKVTIGGFGTFLVSRRAERGGRNPRTGKVIKIPACRVPRFKPSRSLKGAMLASRGLRGSRRSRRPTP